MTEEDKPSEVTAEITGLQRDIMVAMVGSGMFLDEKEFIRACVTTWITSNMGLVDRILEGLMQGEALKRIQEFEGKKTDPRIGIS